MWPDTKTYWLTDRQSQCDFNFDFDFEILVSSVREPVKRGIGLTIVGAVSRKRLITDLEH
jgi:hypothetical protein